MSNMSYCRFQNTFIDLADCYDALVDGEELSKEEEQAKIFLLRLCKDLVAEFYEEDT